MGRIRFVLVTLLCAVGCGDDGGGLEDYYPELPPEGGAQGASAGQVTDASQLLTGPATSGLVGDFFIKNDRASFIVQSPARVIGVVPQGGNLVDAALIDGNGQQLAPDHFGELSLIYLVGRTCEHDRIEIVRDGSDGGAAVLRAVGKSGNNEFINLKGLGALPVGADIDPDIADGIECATTYVLEPGSTKLGVYHSMYNTGPDEVMGPLGTLADTGGVIDVWTNTRGFERADIGALTTLGSPNPSDFIVYQGPGIAYGIIPRNEAGTPHAHLVVAGVSILLTGNSYLLEILQRDKYYLHIPKGKGLLQQYDFVVGTNASDVDLVWRNESAPRAISGRVDWSGGGPATGARVGIFEDTNGNGQIDVSADDNGDFIPDERSVGYFDVGLDGTYSGFVPATGNLLVRAEVKSVGRSQAMALADTVNLTVPSPIKVDFQIVNASNGSTIPGRLVVIGTNPVAPDARVFDTYDNGEGMVTHLHAIRGTTVDMGDGVDPALYLPSGGTYRIYASHGTEWSVASQPVSGSANVNLTFALRQVSPAIGYIASDWHVHQIGSPDSGVPSDERIRSAVSAGIEMFAVTDHDYVSDLQPLVEQMNLADKVRVLPGIEITPFAYGHFNAWPLTPDDSANHGAIDWARGFADGYAMLPAEIFAAARERGAQMIQVNHPRQKGLTQEFQAAFYRANVKYDFDMRTIYGDYENASTPNDWLRLPGESLWSDQFTGLEVWQGNTLADANGDMLRENKKLDRVLRDWFNMLSLGFYVTPSGDSDTHSSSNEAVGMPRTYVRVTDDSPSALQNGSAMMSVLATQTGANNTARDVVVTNGPMIDVLYQNAPALGRAVPATNQSVSLQVFVTAPDWAEFDTVEVFANATPGNHTPDDMTTLTPLKCWTSRPLVSLSPMDPCSQAPIAPEAANIQLTTLSGGGGFKRYEVTLTVTLDAADIVNRPGATGSDAWLVFRARAFYDQAFAP